MKTIVVNLFGGPGTGKSTLAAELFYLLKREGISVELVREYAKEWAWEGAPIDDFFKQIYVFGKQLRRESRLYGKVQVIITDCPIHLSGFYWELYGSGDSITRTVAEVVEEAWCNHDTRHLNFFLSREKKYDPRGRYQTEDQAKAIDGKILAYLDRYFSNSTIEITVPDREKAELIIAHILEQEGL